MQQKPYSGNGKPFIYAMYAPEDREAAEVVLSAMQEKGYELWPSERFDKRRFGKAALVLFFLSPAAVVNEAMNRAIHDAVQQDYAMLAIHLCPTELTPAQRLLLNTQQGIMRHECASEEAFYDKLFGSSLMRDLQVTSAQKRAASLTTWGISAGVLLAVVAAIMLALGAGAQVPKDSLLAYLGYQGRIADIKNIHVYGYNLEQVRAEKVICSTLSNRVTNEVSKTVYYNDFQMESSFGEITDISDFSQLKNLKELSFVGNQITDISPLYSLQNLEYLDLSGNPIQNINGIGALKHLTTLCIGGTEIMDLLPLNGCKSLKHVYVDARQYHIFAKQEHDQSYTLISIGPQEELETLTCQIFGGPEEHCLFGINVKARSGNVYEDYSYEFYKNGQQIQLTGRAYDDEVMDKAHLLVDEPALGIYDPASTYTLIVSCGSSRATYQMWHHLDQSVAHAHTGKLIKYVD